MLQKLNLDDESGGDDFAFGGAPPQADQSHLLNPSFYWQVFKRRALAFVVPFVVVLTVGISAAVFWPPTYLAEGKILVEAQQIPSELVRPTVTSAAQERVQVIEQRTMTRETLLAIVDKFHLFPDKRSLMSPTELVALMKKSTKIEPPEDPLVFSKFRSRNENPTLVFTVGFEYSDPGTAARVANELVTRILNEDLRDRTSRASDTTKFLAREVQKLQADNVTLDAKIAHAKVTQVGPVSSNPADQPASRLAQLRSELIQRSTLYSDKHPVIQTLKRQIEALSKAIAPSPETKSPEAKSGGDVPISLEELESQKDALQKSLDVASAKLDAARMGEMLEKNQQSEKLEVIEQPTAPQDPIRPKRPKIAAFTVLLAFAAGGGLAFLLEMMDSAVRRASDLYKVVDNRLVIVIPYITTRAELRRRRIRLIVAAIVVVVVLIGAVVAALEFLPPLDLLIAKARVGLFK